MLEERCHAGLLQEARPGILGFRAGHFGGAEHSEPHGSTQARVPSAVGDTEAVPISLLQDLEAIYVIAVHAPASESARRWYAIGIQQCPQVTGRGDPMRPATEPGPIGHAPAEPSQGSPGVEAAPPLAKLIDEPFTE